MTSHETHRAHRGFHPFWFWNDRIERAEIDRQLADMADQGIQGVFVHSRQGLEQPYLGAAFFDLVNYAIDRARAHSITVHLYDEYPYPSGAVGGALVQDHPELAVSRLELTRQRVPGGPTRVLLPAGRTLGCVAVETSNDNLQWSSTVDLTAAIGMHLSRRTFHNAAPQPYNKRRFFADQPRPCVEVVLPTREHELLALTLVPWRDHKYWGTFPDVMNPEVVRHFLALTHERYVQRLGDNFGEVASIFIDEVEPQRSQAFVERLTKRHGEDPFARLLAASVPEHPGHLAARREVESALFEGFVEVFERPIAEWCAGHGIAYVGEKPSLRLRQLALMDLPGCEPGHVKAGDPLDLLGGRIRRNALATSSAAYTYARSGSLCECYHSIGWGATLQDAKVIAEGLIAFGISSIVPHAFFYSTRGLRKHDAAPSFFHMPYWPLFGELTRRVGAIPAALGESWRAARVAVLEPSEGLPDATQREQYASLVARLVAEHVEVLVIDTDTIQADAHGPLEVRDLRIDTLVIPPIAELAEATETAIERRRRGGLSVVRILDTADLAASAAAIAAASPPRLRMTCDQATDRLICSHWRDGAGIDRYLLLNTGTVALDLTLEARRPISALPLPGAPARLEGAPERPRLVLEPFESVLLQECGQVPAPLSVRGRLALSCRQTMTLRRKSPNLLRLGRFRLSLDGEASDALVEPAPLANQLQHSGMAFVPSILDRFGEPPAIDFPSRALRYEADFDCHADQALFLALEPGALEGDAIIRVDGVPLDPGDARPIALGIVGTLGWPLRLANQQIHRVSVDFDAASGGEGLIDALYLAGDFSVFASELAPSSDGVPLLGALRAPRESAELSDLERAGLPHYAGVLHCTASLTAAGAPVTGEVEVELLLPEAFEDAVELRIGSGTWHPVPYAPRRALIDAAELIGATTFTVRVATTLARAFQGESFDPGARRYQPVELADEASGTR